MHDRNSQEALEGDQVFKIIAFISNYNLLMKF